MISFKSGYSLPLTQNIEINLSLTKRQGNISSCACFAVITAIEYVLKQSKYLPHNYELSEKFLYYITRKYKNITGDLGVDIESVLFLSKQYGIASEHLFPYYASIWDTIIGYSNIDQIPNKSIYYDAERYKIKSYFPLQITQYNLQFALKSMFPVICVITFSTQSFSFMSHLYTGKLHKSGLPLDKQHGCILVGYNQFGFKFKNTWDGFLFHWGDHGYGYIPYELTDSVILKAWIISGVKIKYKDYDQQSLTLDKFDQEFVKNSSNLSILKS